MEVSADLLSDKSKRDYQLVCRARETGDEKAFADLMKTYREPLYLMMLKMTNDPTDADDMTIEAFGKAFNSLHQYSPTHTFSTWLFSIASNNCIDYIRKKRVQTVFLDDMVTNTEDEEFEFPVPSEDINPEEGVIREQRFQILRDVLQQMKPCYREILELRYFDEKSYEEIAEIVNLPLGTVKSHLFRARDLLSNVLRQRQDLI